MVGLFFIALFPAGELLRLCGMNLILEAGPQNNSVRFFIAAMVLNSLIVGLLGAALVCLFRRRKRRIFWTGAACERTHSDRKC